MDSLENEEWKSLPQYPRYEASSEGRIKSRRIFVFYGGNNGRRYGGAILATRIINSGYYRVHIQNNVKGKHTELVHRLVASAFLGDCPKGYYVNHIDGDKLNNRIENLEYVSPAHNAQHAFRTGLNPHRGENHVHAKLTEEQVRQIRAFPKEVTARQIKEEMNLDMQTNAIRGVRSGRSWKHVK